MKNRLKLDDLKVKSFVTGFGDQESSTIKGGNTGMAACAPGSTIGSMAACPSNGCSNNSCPGVNGCHAF
ncbi:pinensin family lanthipeptide [Ekhidna sp.]